MTTLSLVSLHTSAVGCRCAEQAKRELIFVRKFIKGACVFLMRFVLFVSALKVTLIEFSTKIKSGQAFAATCLLPTFRLRKSWKKKNYLRLVCSSFIILGSSQAVSANNLQNILGIKESLMADSLSAAQTKITNYTGANAIEGNYKTFYKVYVKTKGNSYTSADSLNLINLANMCPFIDGTAVYQSRGLLKHYDSTEYVNSCELPQTPGGGNRLINNSPSINKTADALNTKVYPNPASTELVITTEVEGASITIYTIIGELVIQMPLTSTTILKVDELKAGTYLYKITKDNTLIKADKLIINH